MDLEPFHAFSEDGTPSRGAQAALDALGSNLDGLGTLVRRSESNGSVQLSIVWLTGAQQDADNAVTRKDYVDGLVAALTWSDWEDLPLADGVIYAGHGAPPQIRRLGSIRWLRGRVKLEAGGNFPPGANTLAILDEQDRPEYTAGGSAETSGFASVSTSRVEILGDGTVEASNGTVGTGWFSLDNTFYDLH